MPRTPLMQRLLKLTSTARKAKQQQINEIEFAEHHFSRRQFLQTSSMAAIAAAALASCTKVIEFGESNDDDLSNSGASTPSIAIIGGGIAGLNAAFQLQNAGVPSTIYDANTRAGGRMFTAQSLLNTGLSTELGGEFIDSGHHDMRLLAKRLNLPLIDLYQSSELELRQNIYFFNGTFYSNKDFLKAIAHYLPAIDKDANSLSGIIKYNHYSPTDKKFDNMNIEQYFDSINITGWLRELLLVAYLGEYGLNTDVCNAINFLWLFGLAPDGKQALYGYSDERYKVEGGNQKIVDALYNELKHRVYLQHKLLKIESKGTGYKLYFDGEAKSTYADIVLLALPFTLLREVEINVDLPEVKRNAINNLGYGNNSKLMLGFNGRIWRTKYNSVGMSYSDNGTQNTWDNSQLQPGKDGGLTVYLGGDDAVKLGNGDVNDKASAYLKDLNEIYPGIKNKYNNKAYRMLWPQFAFTKASYSAWTVGQYTTIAGSEGETVGNLFFAGEHTSYNFQGFMNGGAASGRIAAQNILDKIGH
ncbi:MAG: FAD-dependent oxidoreductase [Parafilimonas sp.]|nr:FAD-dependent oxidoreductase [Parafilimonas sp.]